MFVGSFEIQSLDLVFGKYQIFKSENSNVEAPNPMIGFDGPIILIN